MILLQIKLTLFKKMKTKTIITAFILLFSISSFAQNKEHKEYYDSGKLLSVVHMTPEGKKTGEYKAYYETGELMSSANYNNDQLHGLVKDYHQNGKVQIEVNAVNGEIQGEYKEYSDDGKLIVVKNYKNSLFEGETKWFFENGNLEALETYKNGSLHGVRKGYNEPGGLRFSENWADGEKIGGTTYYLDNGQEDRRYPELETALKDHITTNIKEIIIDRINVRSCEIQILYTDDNEKSYISMPFNLKEINDEGSFRFDDYVVKFKILIDGKYITTMEGTYLSTFLVKKEGRKKIEALMKDLSKTCD